MNKYLEQTVNDRKKNVYSEEIYFVKKYMKKKTEKIKLLRGAKFG